MMIGYGDLVLYLQRVNLGTAKTYFTKWGTITREQYGHKIIGIGIVQDLQGSTGLYDRAIFRTQLTRQNVFVQNSDVFSPISDLNYWTTQLIGYSAEDKRILWQQVRSLDIKAIVVYQ